MIFLWFSCGVWFQSLPEASGFSRVDLRQINVDIVVANFRLGLLGGATLFNLITKLNNGDRAEPDVGVVSR